jgi:bifunctional DNase/RNase
MTLRALPIVALLAGLSCSADSGGESHDVPVRVGIVALDAQNAPVVVLEEQDGTRFLPIWIGMDAAHSISAEMERRKPLRPNTHDLAKRVIAGLDAQIARVVVTELRGNTYYAIMNLETHGRVVEIDARPSDAIAIALRVQAPIFVRDHVFEDAAEHTMPDLERRSEPEPEESPEQRIGTLPATPQRSL